MSLLNRTASFHANTTQEAPASAARPLPLLGGRYVTTKSPGSPAEGTYITTRAGGSVQARGTYVTTINRSISERSEGRYTDRG